MLTNTNGPPIAEYEQIVTPVAVAMKNAALNEKDRRSGPRSRTRQKKRLNKQSGDEDDILFEPYLGKLVDLSA